MEDIQILRWAHLIIRPSMGTLQYTHMATPNLGLMCHIWIEDIQILGWAPLIIHARMGTLLYTHMFKRQIYDMRVIF